MSRRVIYPASQAPPIVSALTTPIPVITNASAQEFLPVNIGQVILGMSATNSPTSWAITNGNFDNYYAINNSGIISATQAATVSVTNLFLQSQNFQSASWSPSGVPGVGSPYATVTVTPGATTAPDGTNTATLFSEGSPKVIFLTATGTWPIPADFNSANNTIYTLGAGGGGGGGSGATANATGGGGGGGGFAHVNNWVAPATGTLINVTVGAAGNGGAAGANGTAGGATFFNGTAAAASTVSAGGGSPGLAPVNGGTGGAGGAGIVGAGPFTGGAGAAGTQGTTDIAGGGGGAAGPNGNGGNGIVATGQGGQGDNGFGGLGGTVGNVGNPGAEFTSNPGGATAGSGGGGGGGSATPNTGNNPGGLYGAGGGGGAAIGGLGGPGTQGLIVITYFPINFRRVTQNIVGAANTTYCVSAFLRPQIRTRAALQIDDNNNGGWAVFDLTDGIIGANTQTFGTGWSNFTAIITPAGGGWYRCALVGTSATSTSVSGSIMLDNGTGTAPSSLNYGGAGAATGVYAWGAQLEQNNTFGPYVPTTTVIASQTGQPTGTYLLNISATNSGGTGFGTATINALPASLAAPPLSWFSDWRVPSTIFVPVSSTARLDTTDQYFSNFGSIIQPTFPHSVVTGATQSPAFYLINDVQIYALTTPLTWMTPFGSPYPIRIPPYAPLGSLDPGENFVNFQPVAGSVPVVTSGTFTENLPITQGTVITTFSATSSPTSWAIVNGNFSGYFALSNSGVLTATTAAQQTATNNILQSAAFNTAANWSLTGGPAADPGAIVVGVNTQAAPDGTVTADLLGEGTVASFYRVTQTLSITASIQTVFSCYLKAQTRGRAYLQYDDGSGAGLVTTFDIAGGQIGVPIKTFGAGTPFSAFSSTITPVGNSWFRCTLIATMTPSTTLNCSIGIDAGSGTQPELHSYTGAGSTVGIFAWGAQLEENTSTIGPYVGTTTVPASQTGQQPGTYTLQVTATNSIGTSLPATETISAVQALQPPVVTNQTTTITEPLTNGQTVMTMVATNSPTSWSITAGNSAGDFAIDNTGKITVTAAGAGLSGAANFSLTVQATNGAGSGTGTATINVQAAATGITSAPVRMGGGGFVTGLQMANDGTMVVRVDVFGSYIGKTNGTSFTPLLNSVNAPGKGTLWGFSNGLNGNNFGSLYDTWEVAICEGNSNIIYIVWQAHLIVSQDGGNSWTICSNFPAIQMNNVTPSDVNGPTRFYGKRMAIDPNNGNNVIIGTPANGVYVTNNGLSGASATFTQRIAASSTRTGFAGLAWESGNTGRVIAPSAGQGVWLSTNSGASFALSGGAPTDTPTDGYFANGDAFVCTANLWMFRSGSWFNLGTVNGAPQSVRRDPTDSTHFAGMGHGGGALIQGILTGTTMAWTGVNFGTGGEGISASNGDTLWQANTNPEFQSVFLSASASAFDPLHPQRVWSAYGYGVCFCDPPSKTSNTNISLITHCFGIENLVPCNVMSIPGFSAPLFTVEDQQVFQIQPANLNGPNPNATFPSLGNRSFNSAGWAADWSQSHLGVVALVSTGFYLSAVNGKYAGFSTNGGTSWTQFPTNPATQDSSMITCTDATHFCFIDGTPSGVNTTPQFSNDGGNTWHTSAGAPNAHWTGGTNSFQLCYLLTNDAAGTIYVYSITGGVWKSTDGGANFTGPTGGTAVCNQNLFATMKAVPGQAGNLFITSGGQGNKNYPTGAGFFFSNNGASSWTQLANVGNVFTFGFGQAYPGFSNPTLWIWGFVTQGGVTNYGLWRSRDLGVSDWTYITDFGGGLNVIPYCMSGDMNDHTTVYWGTGGGNSFRYTTGIT